MSDVPSVPGLSRGDQAARAAAGRDEARQREKLDVDTKARLKEALEEAFNPEAADEEKGRSDRREELADRKKPPDLATAQAIRGAQKSGEGGDLADSFNQRNSELPADRLRSLLKGLKAEQTPEEILSDVRKAFENDDALAYEALEYLAAATTNYPDLQNNVVEARKILYDPTTGTGIGKTAVLAGQNIAAAAKSHGRTIPGENSSSLRAIYGAVIGGPEEEAKNVHELFNYLHSLCQGDYTKLGQVIKFLNRAMAFDLKAEGPSVGLPKLQLLMKEIYNLQAIGWVYRYFENRIKPIEEALDKHNLPKSRKMNFENLAQNFVLLAEERFPSVLKTIDQLEKKMKLVEDLSKLIVVDEYIRTVKEVSPRLYDNNVKNQQNLLLVLMDTSEELYNRIYGEEEEENSKGVGG